MPKIICAGALLTTPNKIRNRQSLASCVASELLHGELHEADFELHHAVWMGGRRGAAGVVGRGGASMLCIRAYHLKHRGSLKMCSTRGVHVVQLNSSLATANILHRSLPQAVSGAMVIPWEKKGVPEHALYQPGSAAKVNLIERISSPYEVRRFTQALPLAHWIYQV
ncbi:uncharacterized protein LOC124659044 [Lolium rigidum]|uniref:uncharacterized protein LOC124659044 n=1 Tax=Lolium rigidum TaxID=89674 RepID=UPI001F5C4EE9|nr:uncharacterized protein LOC124659044 [Lolium rigidum]